MQRSKCAQTCRLPQAVACLLYQFELVLCFYCILLHSRMTVNYYIYIICTKHKFKLVLNHRSTWWCVISSRTREAACLKYKFRCETPTRSGFFSQAVKVHLFSFSIFSHVCAISFVSFLPGSKIWEHKGPCLSLDNSHNEWEWERRELWREKRTIGSSLHSRLSFFLMSHFMKPFVSIYLPCERAQGDHQLLCYSGRCEVAAERL